MRRRRAAPAAVIAIAGVLAVVGPARASAGDPLCTADYSGAAPHAAAALRFGIDPGIAGSAGAQLPGAAPVDPARELAAVTSLRPPGRVLVARLNRLFWSDGEAGIARFRADVNRYSAAGIDSEIQVRYHPPAGHDGDIAGWTSYVRHVVDVFAGNPRVVSMTITNEVNVTFSPNTSDGAYQRAQDALIQGIIAGHDEAVRRGDPRLRFGFTYAYRFSPTGDTALFSYLSAHGGPAFAAALGFVGLDFYPGSVFPPVMAPGDTYRHETAQALGVVRDCLMPLGAIGARVPIWLTENGVPTGATESEPAQASALAELVRAVRDYGRTFGVSDYRWFNLRDTTTSPVASLPGIAATFETDGLLHDDYTPKPAYAAYRSAIATFGVRQPPRPRDRPRRRPPRRAHRGVRAHRR